MSDFKNINDFRKGTVKKWQYQDPTYLSFVLMFDVHNNDHSPLLSGAAEEWYQSQLVDGNNGTGSFYAERLEALKNFKLALLTINNEMPWYWQGISGVERLQQYDPLNPYFGGDDARFEITCQESINLTVSGLMHLYKKAVFDEHKWTYILPANLRKFRMYIYVTEVRPIRNMSNIALNGINLGGFPNNIKPSLGVNNGNSEISGSQNRPFFMFNVSFCEFDITSGVDIFADLTKNPEMAAQKIAIKYEQLENLEARVLNGIVKDTFNTNIISPAPESEDYSADSARDFLNDKISQRVEELSDRAATDLRRLAQEKQQELKNAASNTIRRITPNLENIYQNAINRADRATDIGATTRNIGANVASNINENIYNNSGTAQDALDGAAVVSLGNIFG